MNLMPKRTNPRQQIIELLVSMNAGPGCTVTPSKSLHDVHSGLDREVDVVVERLIDRETSTWSYEVVAPRRPADVEWVEAMMTKHENLPTEKLFLVSWSGFTRGATKAGRDQPAGRTRHSRPRSRSERPENQDDQRGHHSNDPERNSNRLPPS
jgi:hypothetical protein